MSDEKPPLAEDQTLALYNFLWERLRTLKLEGVLCDEPDAPTLDRATEVLAREIRARWVVPECRNDSIRIRGLTFTFEFTIRSALRDGYVGRGLKQTQALAASESLPFERIAATWLVHRILPSWSVR